MLAGGLGAIVGDSTLFLIARRSSSFVEPQLARARKNPKVQGAFDFLDRGAPMRLLTDRYVPGLRFVVNATLASPTCIPGVPALGGMLWSCTPAGWRAWSAPPWTTFRLLFYARRRVPTG
jgi:membrane-associated protein